MSSVMQYILALFAGYVYFNALSLLVSDRGQINLDKLGDAIKQTLVNKELLDKMTDAIKGNAVQLVGTVKEKAGEWSSATVDTVGKVAAATKEKATEWGNVTAEAAGKVATVTKEKAGVAYSATKNGIASLAGSASKGLSSMGKSVKSLWRKKDKD